MLKTKNVVNSIKEVPDTWVFEYYLQLPDKLYGQELKIKSVFNPVERTPSMFIYMDRSRGIYRFKDFSSGYQGDKIEIVKKMYDLETSQAIERISRDYALFLENGTYNKGEIEQNLKFKFHDYEARDWNIKDGKYWTPFGISSKILERFNVMPLKTYIMKREDREITISSDHIYAYFQSDGLPYKIYQPKCEDKKFMKLRNYTQGLEQLTFKKPNLVIASSLKDLMTLESMGFKTIEYIAPDSENTLVPEVLMWDLIGKYETVITLFDNDKAGINAVDKYKQKYGINGCVLNMEKDVSDSVVRYGKTNVIKELVPLLKECIHTCRRCPESSTSV